MGPKKQQQTLARSAEDIFSEEYSWGCRDHAIAFGGLARAHGFSVTFVEGADVAFLGAKEGGIRSGHVFIKVYVDDPPDGPGRWVLVDPTEGIFYDIETVPGECLPGRREEEFRDAAGPLRPCGRIEMYEVESFWAAGMLDAASVNQCLDLFRSGVRVFQPDVENGSDLKGVTFRPIPL